MSLTAPTVDAKSVLVETFTWSAVVGTHVGRFEFAEDNGKRKDMRHNENKLMATNNKEMQNR